MFLSVISKGTENFYKQIGDEMRKIMMFFKLCWRKLNNRIAMLEFIGKYGNKLCVYNI